MVWRLAQMSRTVIGKATVFRTCWCLPVSSATVWVVVLTSFCWPLCVVASVSCSLLSKPTLITASNCCTIRSFFFAWALTLEALTRKSTEPWDGSQRWDGSALIFTKSEETHVTVNDFNNFTYSLTILTCMSFWHECDKAHLCSKKHWGQLNRWLALWAANPEQKALSFVRTKPLNDFNDYHSTILYISLSSWISTFSHFQVFAHVPRTSFGLSPAEKIETCTPLP